ncbi:MAG: heparinase II/III-family protein [Gammaproteobacteria bacterium]|nr:heparinase II/III-family protein [Gammaproteobacteria bacterium]
MQPSLNDQGYSRSPIGPDNLRLAVAWYHDEVAAQALHKLYAMGRKRGGMDVWQFGEELPDAGEYVPPGSADMPGSGLVVLRRGKGDAAVCAMLEYGEHGGGHGHPDKLQLILYGLGQTLLPDPGTVGYGTPLHGQWFKTTVAHNALVIDHASQQRTTGKLLHFQPGPQYDVAGAESDGAYPGYHQTRRLLLADRYLVDVFDVAGDKAADLDLFVHGPGLLTTDHPLQPIAEKAPNATYARLEDLQGLTTGETVTATWTVGEAGTLAVTVVGVPETQVAGRCARTWRRRTRPLPPGAPSRGARAVRGGASDARPRRGAGGGHGGRWVGAGRLRAGDHPRRGWGAGAVGLAAARGRGVRSPRCEPAGRSETMAVRIEDVRTAAGMARRGDRAPG